MHQVTQSEAWTMTSSKITEDQTLVMNLLYRALGRNPHSGWVAWEIIAGRIPKALKVAHALVNDELARLWRRGELDNAKRCRFKAGHRTIRYESYPTSLSIETVRLALINHGLRLPHRRAA